MIQFEKTYDINNGNGSVTFKKVDDLTVEAVYNRGTVKGTWDGETLKGTFIDSISNGNGLIHFIFNDNGFEAKWKAGLDEGPLRGKWVGKLINGETNNITKNNDSTQLQNSHFKDLLGSFCKISFTLDNTEEAIQQGGSDNFTITLDIENQELQPANPWDTIEEGGETNFYTGSSHIDIFEDYLQNEEKEYPGYIIIALDDTWSMPFHGIFEIDDTNELDENKCSLLQATLTSKTIYSFLNDAISFIKK